VASPRPNPLAALRARFAGAPQALSQIAGSPRLRREAVGLVFILAAVLSAIVLGRGGDEGRLVAWWGGVLTDSFGRAAPLVPLLLGLVALRALGGQPGPVLEARHFLGGFLFAVAVVGLLQLGAGLADPAAGGYLGLAVATLALRVLGQVGSGLALFVAGVFAVFLLAGSDLQTFLADLRAFAAMLWRWLRRLASLVARLVRALPWPRSRPKAPVGSAPDESGWPGSRSTTDGSDDGPPIRTARPGRFAADRSLLRSADSSAADAALGATGTAPLSLALAPTPTAAPGGASRRAAAVLDRPAEAWPSGEGSAAEPGLDPALDAEADAPAEPDLRITLPTRPERKPSAPADAPSAAAAAAIAGALLPLPDIARLTYYDHVEPDAGGLRQKAKRIEETLASFKVEARVREINPGPTVTQFALEPGVGTKVRRITELQNDLALSLAAQSIRIEAPVPGAARVGLEIPNEQAATIGLRETLESPAFTKGKAKLPIPLGQDVNGRYVVGDLTKMPHLLIAGATGAGKSVCLNCIISTFLLTRTPDELKLVMIDPKMVELTGYNGVPHLLAPVVTEMDKVVGTLRQTLREMERRYGMFAQLGVRNLDGYREKIADEPGAERLPYLVLIIDELADLMMTAPDDVEGLLVRLCQMARATGIHLIIATQRPSVDVVTGLIKANVPSRIAFAVSSLADSRVVLDMPGAERLLGRGDMLFLPADAAKPVRVQGAFLADKDAHYIVEHWHAVAPVPQYVQDWLEPPASGTTMIGGEGAEEGDDPLFDQALALVRAQRTASASMLQRRLRVGYNRAARLIERMEDEGYIGPADGVRGRPVLYRDED
jgi:S-DNA-T family DNA segregation ATPase FtsK/SpoIIIE